MRLKCRLIIEALEQEMGSGVRGLVQSAELVARLGALFGHDRLHRRLEGRVASRLDV